jgi:hypothetical protein
MCYPYHFRGLKDINLECGQDISSASVLPSEQRTLLLPIETQTRTVFLSIAGCANGD